IAETAPPHVMADALAQAFRSDQTPSFSEMVSNLFSASNPEQRAGLLKQLIAATGPSPLANVTGLNDLVESSGQSVTPQRVSQISAEQVQQLATHAHWSNPSIVDHVSRFYAQHPNVVKALGSAAITIAIQHIARRR